MAGSAPNPREIWNEWLKAATAAALLGLSAIANAYDVDAHFYGTYAMARYAGIGHEVAVKLAVSAQWVDESFLSDPVSMILMPVPGIKKRRLLHFPASRVGGSFAPSMEEETFGFAELQGVRKAVVRHLTDLYGFKGDFSKMVYHADTVANDAVASTLLMEALREGNLMKAGASLHVIEDSYAHAGTSAEVGHTSFRHWPDRPFYAVPKFIEMTETVFKALVAIRGQLPPSALDCARGCEATARDLFLGFSQNEDLLATIGADTLKDFEYIEFVLDGFIERAIAAGYLRPEGLPAGETFPGLMREVLHREMFFRDRVDTYYVLEHLLLELVRRQGGLRGRLLDLERIPRDLNLIDFAGVDLDEYVRSGFARSALPDPDPTGVQPFVRDLSRRILIGQVPIPLSPYHLVEIESDYAGPRDKEMELRVRHMRAFVKRQFGVDLVFVPNNTPDESGFELEVTGSPRAEPSWPPPQPGVVYASFNATEKRQFDRMIFVYLFPSLGDADLSQLVMAMGRLKDQIPVALAERYRQERQVLEASNVGFVTRFWRKGLSFEQEWRDRFVSAQEIVRIAYPMRKIVRQLMADSVNTHLKPTGDERYYQDTAIFESYKARARAAGGPGLFPPFLGVRDVWKQEALLPSGSHPL